MIGQPIQVGDAVCTVHPLYKHVGICVSPPEFGGRCFVHNSKINGMVILSPWAEFAAGCQVQIHQQAQGNYADRQRIAQYALSLLGRRYDLLSFNCEDAANLAQSGKMESPQRNAWVGLAAAIALLAVLAPRGK